MVRVRALTSVFILILAGCATASRPEPTKIERARLYIDIANGALAEGDATGALQNLKAAEDLSPNLPDLHHSKALAFHAKGELQLAIQEAERATKLMPTYSDANNSLGKMLLDQGRYQDAFLYLTRAAKDPLYIDSYKAYTNLGILHYRKGEFQKSRENLDKAILNSRDLSCIAYYYRGHISLRESQVRNAIHDYSQATLHACAQFGDAHIALGLALEKAHEYDQARREYVEIQKHFPGTQFSAQAIKRLQQLP